MPITIKTDTDSVWVNVPKTSTTSEGEPYDVIDAEDIRLQISPLTSLEVGRIWRESDRLGKVEEWSQLGNIAEELGITREDAAAALREAGEPEGSSSRFAYVVFDRAVKGWDGFDLPNGDPAPCSKAMRDAVAMAEVGLVRWVVEQVQALAMKSAEQEATKVADERRFREGSGDSLVDLSEVADGLSSVQAGA